MRNSDNDNWYSLHLGIYRNGKVLSKWWDGPVFKHDTLPEAFRYGADQYRMVSLEAPGKN